MTANDWAGLILAGLSIAGLLFAALRWLIRVETPNVMREEIRTIVKEEVKTVTRELTNNGGSSTKDKIDYIFKHIKEQQDGTKG